MIKPPNFWQGFCAVVGVLLVYIGLYGILVNIYDHWSIFTMLPISDWSLVIVIGLLIFGISVARYL